MGLQIPTIHERDLSQSIEVDEKIFGDVYNETLIHQLVTQYISNGHVGTKSQKTRSEVSGGGAKPWRQKGTGRARSGSTRSPIWRKGGVTFAAKPNSKTQKINKKMYREGLRSIFSELLRQGRLYVSSNLQTVSHKTKDINIWMKMVSARRILIIIGEFEENLYLATRNLPMVNVLIAGHLNPVLLVSSDKVIVTPEALKKIKEHLQ